MNRREFVNKAGIAGVGIVMTSGLTSKARAQKAWWDNSDINQKTKTDYPYKNPPGEWQMSAEKYVSGSKTTIEIRYVNGPRPLPANSYHRLSVEPLSVKSLFHCHPSEGFKVVPFKGDLPEIDFVVGSVSGLGSILKLSFPKGLRAGESFAVKIGNDDGGGSIEAIVNPIPVENLPAMVFSNLTGTDIADIDIENRAQMWATQPGEVSWFDMGWTDRIPKTTIIADKASAIRLFGPTLVKTGSIFDLRIAVTDQFDSRSEPFYQGTVETEKQNNIKGLPERSIFKAADRSSKLIKGLRISRPGIYRIKARLGSASGVFESNPIVVKDNVANNIYWGNIHNHNCYSECWGGSMDRFYSFAREISGMDFVSISDHMTSMPGKDGERGRLYKWKAGRIATPITAWEDTVKTADKHNKNGRFAALIGYEWGGKNAENRSYHMNVYCDDAKVRNMAKYFTPEKVSAAEMYELLKDNDHVLFIGHKHGVFFAYEDLKTTLDKEGYPITPGIEVYSDWGDAFSPYGTYDVDSLYGGIRSKLFMSYMEAIDKGYKLCVIADSDSHTGLPGRRFAAGLTLHHDHPQGITAVISDKLSRSDIIRGYQKRKTYGTTGERIYLDVSANGAGMGDDLKVDTDFEILAEIAGTDTVESVSLFDGMKLIETVKPGRRDCKLTFKCAKPSEKDRPYFIKVIQKDQNRAWSTPIWVSPA
jgi:hypothetical protein